MKKLKVMTVVGTRPEIIRLSAVIRKLEESPAIEHILVHTGQIWPVCTNICSMAGDSSSLRMTAESLIISGRVPTTVITFNFFITHPHCVFVCPTADNRFADPSAVAQLHRTFGNLGRSGLL